ncbi:MAG: uroporphyrinogen decarboxylase family protein [Armatimonadota bacterium]
MTSRQRLKVTLAHGQPDRVPLGEFSVVYWPETLVRWKNEGAPEDLTGYYGLDRIEVFGFDANLRLPVEILETNDKWRIYRDCNGVSIKEWTDTSDYSPQSRVDCLVKNWDEWLKVKDQLQASPDRISPDMINVYKQYRADDKFVAVAPIDPMWFLIESLTGFETGLPLLAEEPELAMDIMTTYTDFSIGMCQLCVDQGVEFDALWFFSDLCYKNGMLFSPKCYREMLMPLHARFREWCDSHNMAMLLHCDGDVREFIPLLIEVGYDAIQPLEARCGNDVRELKKLYGNDIVFFGNISADVLANGTDDEVEEEVRTKVMTAKQGGGYIYHIDHSVPPTISFPRYSKVIELVKQYGQY